VTEKTITIFRNKKPKNLKFGLLGFLGFLKSLKNLGFLKAASTALVPGGGANKFRRGRRRIRRR